MLHYRSDKFAAAQPCQERPLLRVVKIEVNVANVQIHMRLGVIKALKIQITKFLVATPCTVEGRINISDETAA